MPLDIVIQKERKVPCRAEQYEVVLQFEDDGYFWFLYPVLKELSLKTGQMIDLYEDAFFSGAALEDFQDMIVQARQLLSQQPKTWEQHVGTQMQPVHKELYSTVHKSQLEEMLNALEKAVASAKASGAYLTFWGD